MNKCLKFLSALGFLVLVGLVFTACGGSKDPQALTSRYADEFKSAPPGIKAAWDGAAAAAKTNGYAMAIATLQMLQGEPGLSEKQMKAVAETATAISDKMYDAINKGDANAQQELEAIKAMRRR